MAPGDLKSLIASPFLTVVVAAAAALLLLLLLRISSHGARKLASQQHIAAVLLPHTQILCSCIESISPSLPPSLPKKKGNGKTHEIS